MNAMLLAGCEGEEYTAALFIGGVAMPIDERYFRYREDSLGKRPAELLLTNCKLVNVLSGRIEEGVSIAVSGISTW